MDFITRRLRRYLLTLGVLLSGVGVCKAAALEPLTITDFSIGLQTKKDASKIDKSAAQDLQNVDVHTGTVQKRRGSVLQNSSPVGGFASQADRFIHQFVDSNGNMWLLVVSSNSLYGSRDGGVTYTLLTSTYGITSSSRFSAVNAFGKCRLTDGTTNWILFDGSTISNSTASPKGKICEFYGERVLTAVGSTFDASRNGNAEDWLQDDGTDADAFSTQIRQNDGYSIRAIKRFKDSILVFKDYSIDKLTLTMDGLTFIQTPVSSEVGTQYPESVQARFNDIIWLGHNGFYSYDGARVQRISEDIGDTISGIQQLNSTTRSYLFTTAADWNGGTVGTGLSTTTSSGSVVFAPTVVLDDFSDGNATSNPKWTTLTNFDGTLTVVANKMSLTTSLNGAYVGGWAYIGNSYGVGSYSVGSFDTASYNYFKICNSTPTTIGPSASDNCYGAVVDDTGYPIVVLSLYRKDVLLASGTVTTNTPNSIELARSSSGGISAYFNNLLSTSAVDTTFSSFSFITYGVLNNFWSAGATKKTADDFRFDYLSSTYTTSVVSMSGMSTYGPFSYDNTLASGTLTYTLYSDTDTSISTNNATTFIASGTFTNGATPVISTGAFAVASVNFQRTTRQYNPSLDALTLAWNVGSSFFPVPSVFFEGDYLAGVSLGSQTGNDTILVYDRNNAWTKYTGLPVYSMDTYRQKPYIGSNVEGDVIRIQADNVTQDYNGSAINSYWISKEFDFGYPLVDKTMQCYYVTSKYHSGSSGIFSYGVNRGTLTTAAINFGSTSGFSHSIINPTSLTYQRGITHRFEISDNTIGNVFDLLSVSMTANLETPPR